MLDRLCRTVENGKTLFVRGLHGDWADLLVAREKVILKLIYAKLCERVQKISDMRFATAHLVDAPCSKPNSFFGHAHRA